jgi:putative transposase
MPRKTNTLEQINNKLRQAEVFLNQSATAAEVCHKITVTDYTFFRWRQEYGSMMVDQAKRLKELELMI